MGSSVHHHTSNEQVQISDTVIKDRRAAARASVNALAKIREPGRNPFEVELDDLSSSGFRLKSYARLQIGTRFWVTLPDLHPLEAVIRRVEGNDLGCEFIMPLYPSVARHFQIKLHRQ